MLSFVSKIGNEKCYTCGKNEGQWVTGEVVGSGREERLPKGNSLDVLGGRTGVQQAGRGFGQRQEPVTGIFQDSM